MNRIFDAYYRDGLVYLQPTITATDSSGLWSNLGGTPGEPIIVVQPNISDLAVKIPEVFSYSTTATFMDRKEIEIFRKSAIKKLVKLAGVDSYKQFQKGTSQIFLVKRIDKIEGVQGYPDEKNRGWVGRGSYEDRLFFDAPFNYEEIAEAVLKHLLNPANRYPEE